MTLFWLGLTLFALAAILQIMAEGW